VERRGRRRFGKDIARNGICSDFTSVVVVVLAVTGVLGVLIDKTAEPNRTDRPD
jgi:hypothetical protein